MSEVIAMEANEPATMFGKLPAGWGIRQLRDIVPDHRRVTYGIVQPGIHDPQGVLLIRGQDYIKGWAEPDEFFRVARPLHEIFKRSATIAGDLLICIVGATTGATNIVPAWVHEANITQTTARIACDARKADSYFVLFALVSEIGQRQVRKYVKGSAQPGMNLADVECFHIPLPPLSQQRKIARILTTLDNVIAQTEALIAKYQAIKQGLMHDLFTRGVDATGKLRPPQSEAPELYKQSDLGWIPKEWEVRQLRTFLSYLSYGFTNPMPETEEGPWMVTAANVSGGAVQYETCRHTSSVAFNKLLTNKSRPVVGDILLTKDGTLGRIAIVDREGICINQSVAVLRPNGIADATFLKLLLQSPAYQKKMLDDAGGSTIRHIYITVVDKMLVATPQDTTEQLLVAQKLFTLDRLLLNERSQLNKLAETKTGLMQDLLTGKVRVNAEV